MRNTSMPCGSCSARSVAAMAAMALLLLGCEPYFDRAEKDAGKTDTAASVASNYAGTGIGSTCANSSTCRAGLTCQAGKCAASHTTAVDGKCLLSAECGAGLHCSWAGFCTAQPAGNLASTKPCTKSAECAKGLWCKPVAASLCGPGNDTCGQCVAADAANPPNEGETCTASSECPPNTFCDLSTVTGGCKKATGTVDLGGKCKTTGECQPGLMCSAARGECVPGSVLLNPDVYGGVECADQAEASLPFGAIVTVPRKPGTSDFYALPFPNDAYKKAGQLDLSGHPRPGAGLIGFDLVGRMLEAIAADMPGYGLSTAAYLRFTHAVDTATLKMVPAVPAAVATVRLVNLKTGVDVPMGAKDVQFHQQRNKYICHNWLYMHARWSELLDPDVPYAALVTDGIRQACGNGKCEAIQDESNANCPADCQVGEKDTLAPTALKPPQPGADLPALLADTKPSDTALEAAWTSYAPLRTWLKGNPGVKPVSAAVFTTTDTRKVAQQLVDAVAAANKPAFPSDGKPVLCTKTAKSPCADPNWASNPLAKTGRDPRECPENAEALPYHEIHAKLTLPVFQDGTRPYLTYSKPTDKVRQGALHTAGGKPAIVDYENVCVALTIPKFRAKPAAGWPLLMFAHGTGGSFRSGATGMAAAVSPLAAEPTKAAYATLGIDQPMHANRRGKDSAGKELTLDPGPLFYNFANPAAARGNFWQGAADNYALLRWVKAYLGEDIATGPAQKVTFDPANLVFMGHSQGSTSGPISLPYMQGLKAAVLSGCGASLPYGLMGKKKPYDAAIGITLGLQDLGTDAQHPVLNLLQNYFEVADPLIYAPLLQFKPVTAPIHVLHTYGIGDSYTPETTSRIFAAAARTTLGLPATLPPWLDKMDDLGVPSAQLPIKPAAAGKVIAVTLEAKNDAANSKTGKDYDGHFVAFNDKTLANAVLLFLDSLAKGAPTVPK